MLLYTIQDFSVVVRQIGVWIGQFLAKCQTNWLLTVLLFLIVLDLIVSVLISVRGGH